MSLYKLAEAEKIVKAINELTVTAIEHGGDAGGAYFSCYGELREKLEYVAILLSELTEHLIIVTDVYDGNGRTIKRYDGEEYEFQMLEVAV